MHKSILILAGAVAGICIGFFLWAPAPAPESILAPSQEPAALNETPPVAPALRLSVPEEHRPQAVAASEPAGPTLAASDLAPKPVRPPVRADLAPPAADAPAQSPSLGAPRADDREVAPVQRPRIPPAASGQPAVTATPLPAVVDLEIPAGARLPLALVESGEALSREQITAVDATATDFVQAVIPGAPGREAAPKNPKESWSRAQRQADERYRLLFGNQAADQAAVRGAREAGAPSPPQTR